MTERRSVVNHPAIADSEENEYNAQPMMTGQALRLYAIERATIAMSSNPKSSATTVMKLVRELHEFARPQATDDLDDMEQESPYAH